MELRAKLFRLLFVLLAALLATLIHFLVLRELLVSEDGLHFLVLLLHDRLHLLTDRRPVQAGVAHDFLPLLGRFLEHGLDLWLLFIGQSEGPGRIGTASS